jgi:hypothetical protein
MKKPLVMLAAAMLAACASYAPQTSPDAALDALVEDYFEQQLQLSPMNATAIGDSRYDDRTIPVWVLPEKYCLHVRILCLKE